MNNDTLGEICYRATLYCPVAKTDGFQLYGRILVYYPRGLRTGGPEALHQLVDSLRRQGQDALLVPLPGTEGEDRVAQYSHYDAPEGHAEPDRAADAVIAPERALGPLRTVRHATRIAWWLSVDNSKVFWHKRRSKVPELRSTTNLSLAVRGYALARALRLSQMEHIAQSHYAWNYVASHLGVVPSMVSDFTPLDAIESSHKSSLAARGRTIAYNPAKGGDLLRALANNYPSARFVPIEGMSRLQVLDVLSQSAIYIDLGHHPGKDRMPREAVMCGAIAVVGKRGAGANSYDLPIPLSHKVGMTGNILENAAASIDQIFSDLESATAGQAYFRAQILAEKPTFDAEVLHALISGPVGFDRVSLPGS